MGLAGQDGRADQRGYAMAALLVGLSVMSVVMAAALPVWSHATRREREAELIWRGEQYKRAIMLFQRKYANTFPPNVDILVEQKFLRKKYKDPITGEDFQIIPVGGGAAGQRPPGALGAPRPGGAQGATGGFGGNQAGAGIGGSSGFGGQGQQPGGFGPVGGGAPGTQPAMGMQGVTSKSTETSIRLYNNMNKYNQWAFVYLAASTQAGAGGAQFVRPGQGANPPGATGGFGPTGFGAQPPPGGPPGAFGPGGGFGQPGQGLERSTRAARRRPASLGCSRPEASASVHRCPVDSGCPPRRLGQAARHPRHSGRRPDIPSFTVAHLGLLD